MTIVASSVAFCLINSIIIRSFGAKPVSGGRPAKERRTSKVVEVRAGALVQDIEISDIFVVEIEMRDINMAVVIRI